MKIERTREELENILLVINEIVKSNKGDINFDKIKEKFLAENASVFEQPVTEEELEEIFRKFDLILFKREYQKFLNTSELSRKLYHDIRFVMHDEKMKDADGETKTVDVAKIKKELKPKFVDEAKKSNQEYSEEDINKLYEKIFEEEYTRFQNVQIYKNTMSNYIKRLAVRENNGNLAKYKTKQKIKEEIQSKLSCEKNELSIELEKMLECFDSVFDLIWDDYYSSDYTKKLLEEQEKNKPKDLFSLIKETMKEIPQEYLKEHLRKAREEQKRREEKDKETLKLIPVTKGEPDFKNQAITRGEKRKKFSNTLKSEKEIKVIPVNREANNGQADDIRESFEKEGEEI